MVSNGCDPDPRVLREAKWLVEAGHDVTIHAFDRSENLPKVQQYAGIKIVRHRVGITPYGSYFRTLIGLQKFRKSVAKEIQDSDVLLCHDADTLHLVNKFTGPTVFDMHDLHHTWVLMKNPSSILRRIISNRMKNSMLKRAKKTTKVITSSSGFSDWLSNYQIHSIPIENRPINNGPIDCNCAFTVGYFGRIREPRSFELLFESVQRIEQQCRPKILIAGEGTSSVEVHKLIGQYSDLEIEFRGPFTESDLPNLMKEITLMYAMYPPERGNIREGAIPAKMFEAAAFGRPSIVNFDTPMGELCENENLGQAISWGDIDGLSKAIMSLKDTQVFLQKDAQLEREKFLKLFSEIKI